MNLKKLRSEAHLTQQKLAEILGVSRSTVAMWETSNTEPDNAMLKRIASLFQISVDDLLGFSIGLNITDSNPEQTDNSKRIETKSTAIQHETKKSDNTDAKKAAADPANSLKQEISSLFDTLTPDDQEKILSYARFVSSSKYTQEQSPSAPRSSRPADE